MFARPKLIRQQNLQSTSWYTMFYTSFVLKTLISTVALMLRHRFLSVLIATALLVPTLDIAAQSFPSPEAQIAGAVSPAPPDMKDGARVLGFNAEGNMIELRSGSNDLICLADNPSDDRFHAACYQNTLEPFMSRGRELKAEGKGRDESRSIRLKEIESGTLKMPENPAALYQLFGKADSFDPATGAVQNVRPLYVMYMPYATPESTGLSSQAPSMAGAPWLMDGGTPWAHIMYSPPQPESDN